MPHRMKCGRDALLLQTNGDRRSDGTRRSRGVSVRRRVGPAVATADDSDNIAELTGLSAAHSLPMVLDLKHGRAMAGHRHRKLGSATASQSVLAQ